MIKQTITQTIRALLSKENDGTKEYRYVIPPYQREYSWQRDQWDELFDDIQESDEGYFLGSMICILKTEDSYQIIDVVDGQQRLTTLSLLLLAIYKTIKELRKNHEEIKNKISDDRKLSKVWLAFNDYFVSDDEENIRLLPSIQNFNRDDYNYLVKTNILDKNDINKPKYFENRRINKAFVYLCKRITDILQNKNPSQQLDELLSLHNKISTASVVRIDTEDEASAFILFESINNRGTSLLPMDLIKNSLIASLQKKDNQINDPQRTNEVWQTIIKNINNSKSQISYLRHFYQAFKPVGNLFNATKGTDKITKTKLIPVYTEAIRNNADEILRNLTDKSEIYKIFIYPDQIKDCPSYEKYTNKLTDLHKLSAIPSYTLLLYLFSQYPDKDFSKLLQYLEKWFIIRHLTNIPTANRLDDIFINLVKTQLKEYDEQKLIDELRKFLPRQERIKADLQDKNLYDDNPNLVRYLLIYLEKMHRTAENQTDFWKEKSKKVPIWSVEHIYPQTPKDGEWDNNCKPLLHSLGNLTLSAYNSNLSNRSFNQKAHIQENGKDIGLKSGNVKINDYLQNKTEWTAEDIKERGDILIEQFLQSLQQY